MKYSIILPCYNESESLDNLIKIIKKFPKKYKCEFILVENGSTDDSKKFFDTCEAFDDKYIRKVYVKKNQGYGYGIIQGLKESRGEYVGWLHSDLQYNPMDLTSFFDYIENHSGEKLLLKGKRKNRKIVEYIFTFGMGVYDSLLFRHKMSNVMAMPVIFNKELLDYIDKFPYDYTIDIFIYGLALKKDYNVVHLPIYLKNREKGVSSWNTGFVSRIKQSKKMIDGSRYVKKELKEIN